MAWLVPTSEGILLVARSGKCRLLLDKAAGGTNDWTVNQGYLCSPHLGIEISVDECVAGGPAVFPSQATLVPKPVSELQMGAKAASQQQDIPEQLVTLQLDIHQQQSLAKKLEVALAIKQARLAGLASRKNAAEVLLAAAAAKKAKIAKDAPVFTEVQHCAPEQAMADTAQAPHVAAAAQAKVRADTKTANANAQTQAIAKAEAEMPKVEAAVQARAQAETFDPEAEAVPDDVKAAAFKAEWTRSRRPYRC